jgi:hypothetical protein
VRSEGEAPGPRRAGCGRAVWVIVRRTYRGIASKGGAGVTPAQWRLSRRVTAMLTAGSGMTDEALAERLNVTRAELRPVVGMLLGRGRVERCRDYLVLVPPAAGDAR